MRIITLVEIGNDGHRTAYMREFIGALLQLNYKVLCLIPDYQPINDWIEIHYSDKKQNVLYASYQYSWKRWNLPFIISERIRILNNWQNISKTIQEAEKTYQIKTDFVFINYIDFFLISKIPLIFYKSVFKYNWAALLISSGTYYIESRLLNQETNRNNKDFIFSMSRFKALAIHDESLIQKLQNRISNKVLLFPEIADLSAPQLNNDLYLSIKEKARQRTIVGTIGLEPHKCGYEFLQLAKTADMSKFFFVFAGIFHQNVRAHYSQQELDEFDAFFSNLPENCYTSFGHINEGVEYNSLFNSFDIVYLLYKNFYNASNRLTKASYFNKLVLATNKGCIGQDVKNYNLGEIADENNINEHLYKIDTLREKIAANDLPYKQWEIYSRKHSTETLKEKFEELLNLV